MEAMTKRLRDNRSRIQAAAAEALGGCGASAAESLPELRRSLTSKSLTVQIAAQDAIARIEQF
jgi:HEAT repeat protein